MKLSDLFVTVLFLSYFHVCYSLFGKKKKFQILKYEACADHPNLPMKVKDFKNHAYGKNNRTMEISLQIDRNLSKDIWSVVSLWKCDSSGAPDTCEFYVKDLKINKLCEKIPQKNQGWTDFVESFEPEFSCPIKKGTYVSKVSYDEKALRFFPLPVGLWKSKSLFYESENLIVCCLDLHVKIFEVREE